MEGQPFQARQSLLSVQDGSVCGIGEVLNSDSNFADNREVKASKENISDKRVRNTKYQLVGPPWRQTFVFN